VKNDRLTDIFQQLIECPAMGEYINPYPPATPESAIRINFEFDEHGHTSSYVILEENNAFDEYIAEIMNAVDIMESIVHRIRFSS